MEAKKPFWKSWWFWGIIVLFIAMNLWINRNQQDTPSPTLPNQQERVGTH